MTTMTAAISRAPRLTVVGLMRGYQMVISPLSGPSCKYYPSCSTYGIEAVRVHGAVIGGAMAAWRVIRCNPWSNGGVDDVPARGERLFRLHRNNHAGHDHAAHDHAGHGGPQTNGAATAATHREHELALTRGLQ